MIEIQKISAFIKSKNFLSLVISILIPLVIFSLMIFGVLLYTNHATNPSAVKIAKSQPAEISGSIDLNGYIPTGATISIAQRPMGQGSFTTVVTGIDAKDTTVWSWNAAQMGVEYDLQASVVLNGKVISQSQVLTVAAPAQEEILRIVSNIPSAISSQSTISGKVDLNGYIPTGATLTLLQRPVGDANFQTVTSNIYPADGAAWSFSSAQTGVTYELRLYLMLNGTVLTRSSSLIVSAPAENEIISLNSTATPPTPAMVSISGNFNVNGVVPNGASISLGQRISGTSQFSIVATNMPAIDGQTWSWNTAQSGVSYDMQAYVQVNGVTTAQSQILTVSAPAQNEVLTFNLPSIPPTPPQNSITNTCTSSQNGLWQVRFTYNNNNVISNAQSFHLTIGTNTGGNQMVDITNTPTGQNPPSQAQTYTSGFVFTTGQTYFAQWSYATCANCNIYSGFSPSLQFYCQNSPTNTPAPLPTNTPPPPPTNGPLPQ